MPIYTYPSPLTTFRPRSAQGSWPRGISPRIQTLKQDPFHKDIRKKINAQINAHN